MTNSLRTIAQITAAIDALVKIVEDVDTFLHELRVAFERPFDGYVVGYDWGMFLAAAKSPMLVGVLNARKFASRTVARDYVITNGKGEVAKTMRHSEALYITIELQIALRANMMEMMADLQIELAEAYALERAADEAAYYDSFGLDVEALLRADIEGRYVEERARKG